MIDGDLGGRLDRFYADPIGFALHYRLRVFGDDIVVPQRYFDDVCATLKSAGFVVNAQKSCSHTPVREACGAYWYSGEDVTITRFQYQFLSTPLIWISWLENAQDLYSRGFYETAEKIQSILNKQFGTPGHLFGQKVLIDGTTYRFNWEYQRIEYCVPSPAKEGTEDLRGHDGLYAWLTGQATRGNIPVHNPHKIVMEWKPADEVVTPMIRLDTASRAKSTSPELPIESQTVALRLWNQIGMQRRGSLNDSLVWHDWMLVDLLEHYNLDVDELQRKIEALTEAKLAYDTGFWLKSQGVGENQ